LNSNRSSNNSSKSSNKSNNKSRKKIFFAILGITAVLIIIFIRTYLDKLWGIATIFIMATVISFAITPPVRFLEKKGIPRWAAILVVYLVIILAIAAAALFLVPKLFQNMKDLAEVLPEIAAQYESHFNEFVLSIKYSSWSEDIKAAILEEIRDILSYIQSRVLGFLRSAVKGMAGALSLVLRAAVAFVLSFYFVKDAEKFKKSFISGIPRKWRGWVQETGTEIKKVLSNFITGQIVISFIVGVMEVVGLYIVGLDYALVLGIIGGIANMIPYFGPYIGAVPAVVLAFVESPVKALWTVVVFVAVQQIENAVITPRVIRNRLGFHPVITILVIFAGGSFFGIAGMLLAVPVTAILSVICGRIIKSLT
jgi:predicted PurR-regulated permease PerM